MRRGVFVIAGTALALCSCGALPPPAARDTGLSSARCSVAGLAVDTTASTDSVDVCRAAEQVLGFFADAGLPKVDRIRISILEAVPESQGGWRVLGYFSVSERHIRLLSFEAATRHLDWLQRPINRPLYRSLAAHEIAHALAWANASTRFLSISAQEYIAYVAMFATMDEQLRASAMSSAPGRSPAGDSEMSDTYYLLAPFRFGVDAYRHYQKQPDGPAFLRAVLRGEVLQLHED